MPSMLPPLDHRAATRRSLLRRMMLLSLPALWGGAAQAQPRATRTVVGVSSGLGDTASMLDAREDFAPVVQLLGEKNALEVLAIPPTQVAGTIAAGRCDVMLVLTSDAWRAQNDAGWRVIALSDDTAGNVVSLHARKGLPAKTPADLKGRKIAVNGTFARDVLGALLRQSGIEKQVAELRDPQALVYFLQNGFADVAATREPAVAAALEQAGAGAFFKTDKIPVYALIANPKLPQERLERLRKAVIGQRFGSEFQGRTRIRAFTAVLADHAVALGLFD
jgi:hypothetical protein